MMLDTGLAFAGWGIAKRGELKRAPWLLRCWLRMLPEKCAVDFEYGRKVEFYYKEFRGKAYMTRAFETRSS